MKGSQIFDELVDEMRQVLERLPDHRTGENTSYEIKDAAVSAFGIFFAQSSSFLAHRRLMEKAKGRSNVQRLFGTERIPSDGQVRNLLDPQEPELLYGVSLRRDMSCWQPVDKWKPSAVMMGSI